RRKGEIRSDFREALRNDPILTAELDYSAILGRFAELGSRLLVVRFEDLAADPVAFYARVRCHLLDTEEEVRPAYLGRANVARDSRVPILSRLLSDAAKAARRVNLHSIVNITKSLGLASVLENAKSP